MYCGNREIDIQKLLQELDQKSQVHANGMMGHEVRVDKQLLRDAYDVITLYTTLSMTREDDGK